MSIRIEDGKGNGNLAGVTSNNKLRTYTTVETEASFESETNGECFTWSAMYDYSAGDTIILIKNINTDKNLLIENISLNCNYATQAIIHSPSNVTSPTGTAITGVNLNRTSGKTSLVTAIQDETSNTQGDVLFRIHVEAQSNSLFLPINGMVVLGFNDTLAIDYMSEGSACYATIVGYFHKIDV